MRSQVGHHSFYFRRVEMKLIGTTVWDSKRRPPSSHKINTVVGCTPVIGHACAPSESRLIRRLLSLVGTDAEETCSNGAGISMLTPRARHCTRLSSLLPSRIVSTTGLRVRGVTRISRHDFGGFCGAVIYTCCLWPSADLYLNGEWV